MSLRHLGVCAALLSIVLAPAGGRVADAQGQTPYELPMILSLTGPVGYGGKGYQQAMQVVETLVNQTGGIQGHPLKVDYLDDQSNPQVAVQLASGLIAKNVPLIFGPINTGTCSAAAPLSEKAGPTLYCLTPGYQPARGSYVFSLSADVSSQGEAFLRYCVTQHWTRLAILATNDASGQTSSAGSQAHLSDPQFQSVKLVDIERMAPTDISVGAQLQRIEATKPDMLFIAATGPPYGTALRGLVDAGFEVPVSSTNGNMSYSSMQQYKNVLPKVTLFGGSRGLSTLGTPKGPILDAQRLMFRAFDAAGLKVDGINENPWDPAWIVIGALRRLGVNATSPQLHDYLENLRGWVGVRGVYNFSDGNQRGLGASAVVIDRWDPAQQAFLPVSGPGGAPLRK